MSELFPFVFVVFVAIVLFRSAQRRQRRSRRSFDPTDNKPAIDGRVSTSSTSSTRAVGPSVEASDAPAARARVAEVLTSVVVDLDQPLAIGEDPPAPPRGPNADPQSTVEAASRMDAGTARVPAPNEGTTPGGMPMEDEPASPVFALVDTSDMDPTIAAAMGEANLPRAARALRNASLNGIAGADLALGMLYWRWDRFDEAEGVLRNIARTDATAANNLAAILETRGHLREAMPFYRRAAAAGSAEATENVARLEG